MTNRRKILIVGNYVPDQQLSMIRFSDSLCRFLAKNQVNFDYIRPKPIAYKILPKRGIFKKLSGYVDKFLIFPIYLACKASGYDVVHITDHSNAIFAHCVNREKLIITCHDLFAIRIMLHDFDGKTWGLNGVILQKLNLAGLKKSDRITFVSESTRADFESLVGSKTLMEVIPNFIDEKYRRLDEITAEAMLGQIRGGKPERFFLHVGGNQFYKNRPGVVRLYARLLAKDAFRDHALVLAGKNPDPDILAAILDNGLQDRVEILTECDDDEIVALYNRAEALLFISTKEGFGWPIIEAQACGCLVVTSDIEPMRSVAGQAAILIDPARLNEAACHIADGIPQKPRLIARGYENAATFKADVVIQKYLALYAL